MLEKFLTAVLELTMRTEELHQRSQAWHLARRGKLTASNLGAALGQVSYVSRQQAYRRALGLDAFQGNVATEWGNDNEANGIMEYSRISGNYVWPTGLHVHPVYSWLAGSPDGLIGSDGMIEVKCPYYKKRPHDSVPGHYWMQVNALLEITKRQWCDYVCWTPNGLTIHRIQRDKDTFDQLLVHYGHFYAAMQRESPTVPPLPKEIKEKIASLIHAAMNIGVMQMREEHYLSQGEDFSDPFDDAAEDQIPPAKRQRTVPLQVQAGNGETRDPSPSGTGEVRGCQTDERSPNIV